MSGLKRLAKPLARGILHGMGGLAALRHRNRQAFRILMYHRFPADPETARSFQAQCAAFRRHYHLVTLTQIAESLASARPLPPRRSPSPSTTATAIFSRLDFRSSRLMIFP